MAADILIYAVVAAGLVFWLRNILGTRHGDEPERPNPFASGDSPPPENGQEKPLTVADFISPEDRISQLSQNPGARVSVENKFTEEGLLAISKIDRGFDVARFVEGAQDAFVIIVEAFARGDRETLRGLLGDSVYHAFESAIEEREKQGETVSTEIHAIRKTDIIDTFLKDKTAFVTVRFTADETCVIRDGEGEIVSGNPERITEMIDVWVFSRDLRSRDPRWLLVETRDDVVEDHKTPLPEAGSTED